VPLLTLTAQELRALARIAVTVLPDILHPERFLSALPTATGGISKQLPGKALRTSGH
jgi:hypothetical protein